MGPTRVCQAGAEVASMAHIRVAKTLILHRHICACPAEPLYPASPFCPETSAASLSAMSSFDESTPFVYADQKYECLVKRLIGELRRNDCRIVLSGPTGAGKLTAIKQAALSLNLPIRDINIETQSGKRAAQTIKAQMSNKMLGEKTSPLVVIHALECLNGGEHEVARQLLSNNRVIVVVTDSGRLKPHLPEQVLQLTYGGVHPKSLRYYVSQLPGAAILCDAEKEALISIDGATTCDVRRVLTNARMVIDARQRGHNVNVIGDGTSHIIGDTRRFLNGSLGLPGRRLEVAETWIRGSSTMAHHSVEAALQTCVNFNVADFFEEAWDKGDYLETLGRARCQDFHGVDTLQHPDPNRLYQLEKVSKKQVHKDLREFVQAARDKELEEEERRQEEERRGSASFSVRDDNVASSRTPSPPANAESHLSLDTLTPSASKQADQPWPPAADERPPKRFRGAVQGDDDDIAKNAEAPRLEMARSDINVRGPAARIRASTPSSLSLPAGSPRAHKSGAPSSSSIDAQPQPTPLSGHAVSRSRSADEERPAKRQRSAADGTEGADASSGPSMRLPSHLMAEAPMPTANIDGPASVACSPSHTAAATHCAKRTAIYGKGSACLVECEAVLHVPARFSTRKIDLQTYAEDTQNKSARRMKFVLLTAPTSDLGTAAVWGQLFPKLPVVGHVPGGACLWRTPLEMVALVAKNPDARLEVEGWLAKKLRRPDPVPLLRALSSFERIGTMELWEPARDAQTQVGAMDAARYLLEVAPGRTAQKAYMTDLAENKITGKPLSQEEDFLLRHRRDVQDLVSSLREDVVLNALLQDVEKARRFPWDFKNLPDASVWWAEVDPSDTLRVRRGEASSNAATILKLTTHRTAVFYGKSRKGKTECALALAAVLARLDGVGRFPFVSTVDSLRKMSENALLEAGMPIVLDEYKPRGSACGAQGGGIDHLKSVVDPTHTKTIEARFNDFALPWNCPRILTTQALEKILPGVSNVPSGFEMERLNADEDMKAVLLRCFFVHVTGPLYEHVEADDGEAARKRRVAGLFDLVEESRREGELQLEMEMDLMANAASE